MIADRRRRIQDLVVRMQQAFLDAPAFRLTLPQARRRFATSAATCEAVLNVLVEAGVLSRRPKASTSGCFRVRPDAQPPERSDTNLASA